MSALAELASSRELLANLTARELRGKYKRSVLGWAWSLINPVAMAIVFTFVFTVVFKADTPLGDPSGIEIFALFLLCGLLPWNYLATGMTLAMSTLTTNANLVKKVYFPREILVVATTLAYLVSLVIELCVLGVVLGILSWEIVLYVPGVVLVVALQTLFVTGVGLALSVLNVYFRDVQHLVNILLQVWFYSTPILYPLSFVEEQVEAAEWLDGWPVMELYHLNPMVSFVDVYRALMYDQRLPDLLDVAWITVASVVTLLVGYKVFKHFEPRLAEEL